MESHRASNARVFGSVARGADTEGSDLDILVDPVGEPLCSISGGLHVELEELLGVSVDLLTPGDLQVKFRARVLAEARPV